MIETPLQRTVTTVYSHAGRIEHWWPGSRLSFFHPKKGMRLTLDLEARALERTEETLANETDLTLSDDTLET